MLMTISQTNVLNLILTLDVPAVQCYDNLDQPTQSVSGGSPMPKIIAYVLNQGYVMDFCNQYYESCFCVKTAGLSVQESWQQPYVLSQCQS